MSITNLIDRPTASIVTKPRRSRNWLPAHEMSLSVPGFQVSTTYRRAHRSIRAGGDFCEVVPLPHSKTALIVGDIAGTGLTAILRIADVRRLLRASLRNNPDPAVAFDRLNRHLSSTASFVDDGPDVSAALSIAVVDRYEGVVDVVTVGMDAPFVVRASGDVVNAKATGVYVGTDQFARYESTRLEMYTGDILAMFTDGITELGPGESYFGGERLAQALANAPGWDSISTTAQSVVSTALDFAGKVQSDDICLLLCRRQ